MSIATDPDTAGAAPRDRSIRRYTVDLTRGSSDRQRLECEDLEDALGGIARGFKILEGLAVRDAYLPEATLVMNLGCLSGTPVMTGLRTFFQAYSPLKRSGSGLPSAMWSAGSGKFGTLLRGLGIDEMLITGRAAEPSLLRISPSPDGDEARLSIEPATHLLGLSTHEKIMALHGAHPDAHFAVIGPAGEHYAEVRYGAIALSTENQLKSGDAKSRFCGRGGMGSLLGSKNLLAIVAEATPGSDEFPSKSTKEINKEIAKGDGSRRFREPRSGGLGGTWANYHALNPSHALPERNFAPTGTDASDPLYRENVEQLDRYAIRGEACHRCGIRCHKNLYDRDPAGKVGPFRAKIDFEPLDLLSSNLGIYDIDRACDLIELVDALGLDSISVGVCLSYAMEINEEGLQGAAEPLAGGIRFGDFAGAMRAVKEIAEGRLPELGQGVLRLSEQLGIPDIAMQSKGVEFPAYLPQTNPGYPWALAGGHMSMRTYLLLVNERETSVDYWADAITSVTRGLSIMRDDILGICKFAGLADEPVTRLIREVTGLEVGVDDLRDALLRTYLRGFRLERRQGFQESDYSLPARAHDADTPIDLPYFNSPEFFSELRTRVLATFDQLLETTDLDA